jgi:hypothetical protein
MASAPSTRPTWQRNAFFRFFASLKLAVILLAVLIVGAIAGTIYESSFDAKVARAYIYGASWFNIWLILLATNLAVSALSRWPWRKHHVAFLITHLGIITLLAGSLIGRIWGIEGTITLFKGEPPSNRLLVDEHQLRVHDVDGVVKGYPAEFLHHPPSPGHPRDLGMLASGARLSVVDYAPGLDGKLNPKPVPAGGSPALHFTINTALMSQHLESWVLAGDPQHGTFAMGLANIELKRGKASASAPDSNITAAAPNEPGQEGIELQESIFAFSKAPEEQIGRVQKGGSVGAKIRLLAPENGNKGQVAVSLNGQEATFDVGENLGKNVPFPGTSFTLKMESYWADFRIQDGKPGSLSDQPNNPAILVTIRGKGVPAATSSANNPNSHGAGPNFNATGGPPTMPLAGGEVLNHLTIFIDDAGAMTYELTSRKNGKSSGKIEMNKPLTTGWADWQLVVDKFISQAAPWMDFTPSEASDGPMTRDLPDGLRVRLQQNGETFEQWVPAGWQITVPTSPQLTEIAYGWKTIPLPIGLELTDFEVKRNEGSDTPAGFKSTLRVSTADGDRAIGQCWMNNPFSYPGAWWRIWTGLTYKISQASWNPENLSQSTVQILRDPGWFFKWTGSLLIVSGVFMMFYLRPYRKQTVGVPITGEMAQPAKQKHERQNIPVQVASGRGD